MGVFVPGRSESANAAAGGSEAGADAGGLWRPAGWQPAITVVFAQPGRKPGSVGRIAARPLSAGAGREESVADRHGWLRGSAGGSGDGVSAGSASALLGP